MSKNKPVAWRYYLGGQWWTTSNLKWLVAAHPGAIIVPLYDTTPRTLAHALAKEARKGHSGITRYTVSTDYDMQRDPDGQWVRYVDHIAALASKEQANG